MVCVAAVWLWGGSDTVLAIVTSIITIITTIITTTSTTSTTSTGEMYRRNVITTVCGRSVWNKSVAELLRMHEFAAHHFDEKISVFTSRAILTALMDVPMQPFRFDLGLAVNRVHAELAPVLAELDGSATPAQTKAMEALTEKLREDIGAIESTVVRPNAMETARDVVLYGFGRIGRLLARMLIEKTGTGSKLLLRAIVVRAKSGDELLKRAYLLAQDSVHGRFPGTVSVDRESKTIVANGNVIHLIAAKSPEDVDYTKYGISNAILMDNTGVFTDRESLARHLKAPGIAKVILTAPAKGKDVPTIVSGVNSEEVSEDQSIYSAASCTTNAIVPVLKVLDDVFGVRHGHVETVHAYTNDQNLIDNYHSKDRRGRAAALNMVLTSTGAASAVSRVLPHLTGKLTGNAVRVPTPCVSLAILNLTLNREGVTAEEVNKVLFEESTWGNLHLQIEYVLDADAVSQDFVGETAPSCVYAPSTLTGPAGSNSVTVYVYYDNEGSYSAQVVRLCQKLAGVVFPAYPPVK